MTEANAEPVVLVVEDDNDSAALLTEHLARLGCRTVRAPTVNAARGILARTRPALVFVDLLLPDGDGRQVVAEIRRDKSDVRVPIVVCSVADRADYPRDVDGVLPKPYTRRQITELIVRLLGDTSSNQ